MSSGGLGVGELNGKGMQGGGKIFRVYVIFVD